MKIKAQVSIQTPKVLYAPGESLTVSKEDGDKLVSAGHAELIDADVDPETEAELPKPVKGKAK